MNTYHNEKFDTPVDIDPTTIPPAALAALAPDALLPHQQRVVTEKEELDSKLASLLLFMGSNVFRLLDPDERQRLLNQASIMQGYSNVLADRIDNFHSK